MASPESPLGEWFKDSNIGAGGFGTVSLWKNNSSDQCFAMKECKFGKGLSEQNRQRWIKEIQIMKKLDHPNIVRALDLPEGIPVSEADLQPLVLEFCEKGDLRKVLRRPENSCGLEENRIREILGDVGAAIEYLHKNKIIHRDLKPENVLMKEEENRVVYKLTDLGYAKDLDRESMCHSFVGTMQYLAPELFENVKYNCTVDYWSFGMIVFECITGVRPFHIQTANNGHWVRKVMNKEDDQICFDPLTGDFSKKIPQPNHLCKLTQICFEKWIRIMLIRAPKRRGWGIDPTSKRPLCFKMMDHLLSLKRVSVYCVSTNTLYIESLSGEDGHGEPDLSANSLQNDSSSGSPSIRIHVADLMYRQTHIPLKQQMYLLEDGQQIPSLELYKHEDVTIYMFDTQMQNTGSQWKPINRPPLVEHLLSPAAKPMSPPHQKRAWSHVVFYCHQMYENFMHMGKACLATLNRLSSISKACSDLGEEITEKAIRLHAQASLMLTSIKRDVEYRQSLGKPSGLDDYAAYSTNTCAELQGLLEKAAEYTSPMKLTRAQATVDEHKFKYKQIIFKIPQQFSERKSEATALYDRLRAALRDNKQLMNDDIIKLLKNCIQDERKQSIMMADFLKHLHRTGLLSALQDQQQELQASKRFLERLLNQLGELQHNYQRYFWGQMQELTQCHHDNQLMNGDLEPHSNVQNADAMALPMNCDDLPDDIRNLMKQCDLDDVESILSVNVSLRQKMASL